jgi:hypothetical protein
LFELWRPDTGESPCERVAHRMRSTS